MDSHASDFALGLFVQELAGAAFMGPTAMADPKMLMALLVKATAICLKQRLAGILGI